MTASEAWEDRGRDCAQGRVGFRVADALLGDPEGSGGLGGPGGLDGFDGFEALDGPGRPMGESYSGVTRAWGGPLSARNG